MAMKIKRDWYEGGKKMSQNRMWLKGLSRFWMRKKRRDLMIFPPEELVFNAFALTPYEKVKVGCDGARSISRDGCRRTGLSFSVPMGVAVPPPSLRNIYKELHDDIGLCNSKSWMFKGVGKAGSFAFECDVDGEKWAAKVSLWSRMGSFLRIMWLMY